MRKNCYMGTVTKLVMVVRLASSIALAQLWLVDLVWGPVVVFNPI